MTTSWNERIRKLLVIVVSITLVVTLLPASAFAAEGDGSSGEEEIPSLEQQLVTEKVSEEEVIEKEKQMDSTTFDLDGNRKMTIFHGQDVRFRDEEGTLLDYDPSLVPVKETESSQGEALEGYAYENKTSDSKQYLPESLSVESPVLMEHEGYSLRLAPLDTEMEMKDLEKNEVLSPYEDIEKKACTAVYTSDEEDVEYSYTSLNNGLKESVVLKDRPESNVLRYALTVEGLTPQLTEEGSIRLLDEKGEEKAAIDRPFMNDASEDAYSEAIDVDLEEQEKGAYILTMTLSRKYLNSRERVYPVTVDPTATWKGTDKFTDVYVISGSPSTNYYSSGIKKMVTGKGTGGTHRTYIRFEDMVPVVKGKYVESANLTVYETSDAYKNMTIGTYYVGTAWKKNKITWKNKPAASGGALATIKTNGKKGHACTFNLTGLVRQYANGSKSNHGLLLKDTGEAKNSYTSFYGSRAAAEYRPKIAVVYYDGPTKASSVTMAAAVVKKGAYARVNWKGITSRNLSQVQYRIAQLNAAGQTTNENYVTYRSIGASYAKGAATSVPVPGSNAYPEGKYRIYIRGVDAGGIAGAGVGAVFTVDGTLPALSGVTVTPASTREHDAKNLSPVVRWTATDANFSKVTVAVDGAVCYTRTQAGAGSYTVPRDKWKGEGDHRIVITAVDKAGNSRAQTLTYYADTSRPVLSEVKITPESTVDTLASSLTPQISFRVADTELKSCQVLLGEEVLQTYSTAGQYNYTLPAGKLTESGTHTFTIRAEDHSGNTAEESLTYYLDCDPPSIDELRITPVTSLLSYSGNLSPLITWDVTDDCFQEIQYSMDGEHFRTLGQVSDGQGYLHSTDFAQGSGKYEIRVRALDKAGNTSETKTLSYYANTEADWEDYAPTGLSCREYYGKRLLTWQSSAYDDQKMRWQLHRSTEEGFTPTADTIICDDLKGNSYLDKELLPAGNVYYMIVAVEKKETGTPRQAASDPVCFDNKVDTSAFANTTGSKDYLASYDFTTPCGEGSIEESSGNLRYTQGDFDLSNEQLTYGLTRTYNSQAPRTSMLGKGWLDSWHKEIYTSGEDLYYVDSDGSTYRFRKQGEDLVCEETREIDLRATAEGYQVVDKDKHTETFNQAGQMIRRKDPNGCSVINVYDERGRLSDVISNEGMKGSRRLSFAYDMQNLYALKEIRLPDDTKLSYGYAGDTLTKVTHRGGLTEHTDWAYAYTEEGLLTEIRDAEGHPYQIKYSGGKATEQRDPCGDKAVLTYEKGETTVTGRNEAGVQVYTMSAVFDTATGRVLSETGKDGNTTQKEYFGQRPYLVKSEKRTGYYEELDGKTVRFRTREDVKECEYRYDDHDNLTEEKEADGTVTTYAYDADENLTEETTREGGEITEDIDYEYDSRGNCTREKEHITGEETETEYSARGTETSAVTVSEEATESSEATHDEEGNVIRETVTTGTNGEVEATTRSEYDAMGRVLTQTDEKGTTTYTYDYMGRVVMTVVTPTEGEAQMTVRRYDANGALLQEQDPRGAVTTNEYDCMNRLIHTRRTGKGAETQTSSTAYGYAAQVAVKDGRKEKVYPVLKKETVRNTDGVIVSEKYSDPAGRLVREVTGAQFTDYTYDGSGNQVVQYTGSTGNDTMHQIQVSVHDENGRVTATIQEPQILSGEYTVGEDSLLNTSVYSDAGNLVEETDENGLKTSYEYDEQSRVTRVSCGAAGSDPAVRTVAYSGNTEEGTRTEGTDPGGKKTVEVTNTAGQSVQTMDLGTGEEEIAVERSYDSRNNLAAEVYGDGSRIEYTYDGQDRMTGKTCSGETGEVESMIIFEYTDYGELARVQRKNPSGENLCTIDYTYDGFGRETAVTQTVGRQSPQTVRHTYDAEGNRTRIEYPALSGSIREANYIYDPYGRLTEVRNGSTTVRRLTYDALGRLEKVADKGADNYAQNTQYAYDALGRMTGISTRDAGGTLLQAHAYTYDGTRIASRTIRDQLSAADKRGTETRRYTYDSKGQLSATEITRNPGEESESSSEIHYGYDNAGNRISETTRNAETRFRYNGLNQMVSEDSPEAEISYSYDARGNLSQTENETTGERTTYRYSVEGTLSSVRKGTGEAMTQVQENLYDHTGARVQSTQEGATHTYCYADGRMLCDGTGSSAVSYLYAGDTVACGYQGEHAYLYMQDQQGSTYGIVREDGAVANTYRYTDFGETEAVTDTGFDNVLCYSGSVYDKVTGLYYLNARYYDPETANFLSQDTYRGETGDYNQWNLYAYCANDPVDHVDPSGHDAIVLRSSFPVVGHLAIIVQSKKHSGKWYYFSYDDSGWSGKKIKENVTKYVDNKKKRIKKGFNKRIGRCGKSCRGAKYEKSLFIGGNFSKSYKYIKKQKRIKQKGGNPEFDNYGFTTYNCSWMAVYVLSKGRNKYRKMFKEMLYVKNEKEGIKAVRTHIPNVIFHEISKVCGVKPVSVPR